MNDIQELIKEAREFGQAHRVMGETFSADRFTRLADALEALNRENEELIARVDLSKDQCNALVDQVLTRADERDALRAQLDSMYTEVRSSVIRVDERGRVKVEAEAHFLQRLVGPWVEVS